MYTAPTPVPRVLKDANMCPWSTQPLGSFWGMILSELLTSLVLSIVKHSEYPLLSKSKGTCFRGCVFTRPIVRAARRGIVYDMYMYMYIYIYIYIMYSYMYICLFMYLCLIYVFMCIYIYIYIYIHMYIYIYIYTHKYIYIYIYLFIYLFIMSIIRIVCITMFMLSIIRRPMSVAVPAVGRWRRLPPL